MVKYLVEKDADVNAKGALGQTPLKGAAFAGKQAVVTFLKQHGAKE